MTLVRWDPFRELEDMSDRLNRMMSRPALPRTNAKETMVVADWVPSVDVSRRSRPPAEPPAIGGIGG